MIRRIHSDLPSFKTLSFGPGLNILCADKSAGATSRQTRNGAGKTSLVEIVHFLLGAEVPPDSIFRNQVLAGHTFSADIDIAGTTLSVQRTGSSPNIVTTKGHVAESSRNHHESLFDGSRQWRSKEWREFLGQSWFGLPPEEEDTAKFRPTFRSLISYYARRQESGGFQDPLKISVKQQLWNQQVSLSYLLGLNWSVSQRFQLLRRQEKTIKDLRRAAREGELGRHIGRAAELRPRLTVARSRALRIKERLDRFQVIPEYKELEREADTITQKIKQLNSGNLIDMELMKELETYLEDEIEPLQEDLKSVYAEASVVFPDSIRNRLEQVEAFHRTVVRNRKSHLESEIRSARERVYEREHRKENLGTRRQQIMRILQSGGALESYTVMREEMGRAEAECEVLGQRLEIVEELETRQEELETERASLARELRDDLRERSELLDEATLDFANISESLYERPGTLTVLDTKNGPEFGVWISSERSKGISNMRMFCLDMLLAQMQAKQGKSPGFLIHDSHLFDGVDERQVAKALQLGADRSAQLGLQYIVTMNTDILPRDGFRADFVIRNYVLDVALTDVTETGGLFGLRFD